MHSLQNQVSEENLLQTSLSSDCLIPYHGEPPMFQTFHVGKPQRCSSPQLAKLQLPSSEADENKRPSAGSFDVAHSLPSCLNEHVRQQAKARAPRVRVIRKSANQACALSCDQHQLHSNTARATSSGAATAFQVSWPLPNVQTAVALTDIAALAATSSAGTDQTWLCMLALLPALYGHPTTLSCCSTHCDLS